MWTSIVITFLVYSAMWCYQFTWYGLQYFEVDVFSPGNSMLTKFGNFMDADEDRQDVSERLEHKRGVVLRMFKTFHVFLVIEPSQ